MPEQRRNLSSIRSLADDLRSRDDSQLVELLKARPDLAHPAPVDLTSLAARATTRASVLRAVEALDLGHLQVLQALATAGDPLDEAAASRPLAVPEADLADHLDRLWAKALLWRDARGLHLLRPVSESLEPLAADAVIQLGPPAVPLAPHPSGHRTDRFTMSCGAAASRLLECIDDLAAQWDERRPRLLRHGGLAVRDLRLLAAALDVTEAHAALVVEVAHAAGLIVDDRQVPPQWSLTEAYDQFQTLPAAQRWAVLARAWLGMRRAPHLIGTRVGELVPTSAGTDGVLVNALSTEVKWPGAHILRRSLLTELAGLDPVERPDRSGLQARVHWRHPRSAQLATDRLIDAVLEEAEFLGLTEADMLSPAARALLQPTPVAEGLDESGADWLPPAADHIVLQADLTATVPGRAESELGALLRLSADPESRGGATVYRFSETSLNRWLNAGKSPESLLKELERWSRTPIPQPLRYLVCDLARRARVVVGVASAYLRADDPAVLDAVLARRELARLELRRLAPTVLVSTAPASSVLARLRDSGLTTAVETTDGTVALGRTAPRVHSAGLLRPPVGGAHFDQDLVTLVGRLRTASVNAGQPTEAAGGADRADPLPAVPTGDPTVTLAVLREAVADRRPVWIGVADSTGDTELLLLHPDRVEAGRVSGTVEGSTQPRTFSIHRITGAIEVGEPP